MGSEMCIRDSAGADIFTASSGSSVRVLLRGAIRSGTVLSLDVADVNRVGSFSATLEQAADADTYEQRDLSGYSISITRGP